MTKIVKTIAGILWKIGSVFHIISKKIHTPLQEKRIKPWLKINGDRTLRLDYNLDSSSVVFDIGGYEGQWTSDIFSKYLCTIYVFEPVKSFYQEIKNRFKKNDKIYCNNLGASNVNYETEISLEKNSSSLFKKGDLREKIKMVDFVEFLRKNNINKIDLIKINIEGGEYDLLEHLIEKKFIERISNIQVQFHDFVLNSKERMEAIHRKLSLTHNITYRYEFVWENWKLKLK